MKNFSLMDKISYYVFLTTAVLLPFFFIPTFQFSLSVSKGFLFSMGILISLFCWLIARIIDGKISLPKSRILTGLVILAVVYLISALFSPAPAVSFWGQSFETETFLAILIFSLAAFLAAVFFGTTQAENQKRLLNFQILLVASFALTAVFWILNLVFHFSGAGSSFFGALGENLFGSLNDLAIFGGLVSIICLIALEVLPLSKIFRVALWPVLALSLFAVAAIGFSPVWIAVGVFALIFFVYRMTFAPAGRTRRPLVPLFVALLAAFFLLVNTGFLANYLGIKNIDVRPGIPSTFEVIKESLKEHSVLGVGPNRFSAAWALYKPALINQTQFWDFNFNFGFGFIPSLLVTTGVLGGLAWFLVAVLVLMAVIRGLRNALLSKHELLSYLFLSSAAAVLYLWIFNFIYVPSLALIALAFIFTGLLVGSLASVKEIKVINFSFLKDPRLSFFSILLIVVLLLAVGFLGYRTVKKFASIVSYERAAVAIAQGGDNLDQAERRLMRAISFEESDLYFRSLTDLHLFKMKNLLATEAAPNPDLQAMLQDSLNKAEQAAKLAVEFDRFNYQNWLNLGALYGNVLALGVEGSYEGALSAYNQASKLNPSSPGIDLRLGLTEAAQRNFSQAKFYFERALSKKPDYEEAAQYLETINNLNRPSNNGTETLPANQ